MLRGVLVGLAAIGFSVARAQAPVPPPIASFAAGPSLYSPSLSPNGRYVAMIVSQEAGDALVVTDLETSQSTTVASARRNNPSAAKLWLNWAEFKTEDRLVFSVSQAVYMRDGEVVTAFGDGPNLEEYAVPRVLSVDRSGANVKAMFEGQQRRLAVGWVSVHLESINLTDPSNVLLSAIGHNGLALYRANVDTGKTQEIENGTWDTSAWYLDGEGTPVLRVDAFPNGSGYKVLRRAPGTRNWVQVIAVKEGGNINLPDFIPGLAGPGRGQVYVVARPGGAERAAVYLYNAATGELGEPIFSHPSVDAEHGFVDASGSLLVACAESRRLQCTGVSPSEQAQLQSLQQHFGADRDVSIVAASANGQKWVVLTHAPSDPGVYSVFDRASGKIVTIGGVQREFRGVRLAPTEIVTYRARDGTELFGYLTRFPGAGPQPAVLLPHGGPEARDTYNYDPLVQLLATRGYAVFQPQFRGSAGFGRAFANAGRKQWGLRMQDDLTDGARHLVSSGVAAPGRMCIVGASYGGYAALVGAALTPDLYRCVVSIAGISDLIAMMDRERIASGRGSMEYDYWLDVIGDPNRDREQLTAASPRRAASRIAAPVLLIHGDRDGVVPIEQTEYMRDALRDAGKAATFLKFEKEGHNFYSWRVENRQKLYTEIERFLATHLPVPAP